MCEDGLIVRYKDSDHMTIVTRPILSYDCYHMYIYIYMKIYKDGLIVR